MPSFASPDALIARLEAERYFTDEGLATAGFLALRLGRPLFLEGEPGVGKTSFAQVMARLLGIRFERLQCYEGIDAAQALYDWNFPKQLLHLRALGETSDRQTIDENLYREEYLSERPVLRAIRHSPSVLLIDEIDRADEEFEALLLEFLERYAITIPEYGEVRAATPPLVVLTSNRTRDVHDALKRRCLYHWIPFPARHLVVKILRTAVPDLGDTLAAELGAAVTALRKHDLAKPPAVAEAIDGGHALRALGEPILHRGALEAILSTLIKQEEDLQRVRSGPALADAVAAADEERRRYV